MTRATILTALTLALLPAAARADDFAPLEHVAPATNVQADSLLRDALVPADAYWTVSRCPAELYVYDEPKDTGAVARAEIGGCKVWVDRSYRDWAWSAYTDRYQSLTERREVLVQLCAIVAHERGHNLGFQHSLDGTGLMAATVDVRLSVCIRWSRAMLPRPKHVRLTQTATHRHHNRKVRST